MEPATRIAFEYPVYAMDLLDDGSVAVAGGGGRMKSGIPNACEVVFFDDRSCTLSRQASICLADAPVALATHGATITAVIGPGYKNFLFHPPKHLAPESSFMHDLQVHTTLEQTAVAVSKDGNRLVVASDEGHVTVLQLPHREMLLGKRLHTQGVTDLSITANGELIATTARDRTAYICRADTGELVQEINAVMPKEMRTHVRAIRFAPSQPSLIFTAESNPRKGGWIAAWRSPSPDGGNWGPVASVKASTDALTAFTINSNADIVAVSSSEGHVSVFHWTGAFFSKAWSTEPGHHLFRPPPPPHVLPVTAMRFTESGTYLLTSSADYTVAVWPTRRPTNWRRVFKIFFWISTLVVALFAVLAAEDQHLPEKLLKKRKQAEPYMEPLLSAVQRSTRPPMRQGIDYLKPHYTSLRSVVDPYAKQISEQTEPVRRMASALWEAWAPTMTQNVDQISEVSKQVTASDTNQPAQAEKASMKSRTGRRERSAFRERRKTSWDRPLPQGDAENESLRKPEGQLTNEAGSDQSTSRDVWASHSQDGSDGSVTETNTAWKTSDDKCAAGSTCYFDRMTVTDGTVQNTHADCVAWVATKDKGILEAGKEVARISDDYADKVGETEDKPTNEKSKANDEAVKVVNDDLTTIEIDPGSADTQNPDEDRDDAYGSIKDNETAAPELGKMAQEKTYEKDSQRIGLELTERHKFTKEATAAERKGPKKNKFAELEEVRKIEESVPELDKERNGTDEDFIFSDVSSDNSDDESPSRSREDTGPMRDAKNRSQEDGGLQDLKEDILKD